MHFSNTNIRNRYITPNGVRILCYMNSYRYVVPPGLSFGDCEFDRKDGLANVSLNYCYYNSRHAGTQSAWSSGKGANRPESGLCSGWRVRQRLREVGFPGVFFCDPFLDKQKRIKRVEWGMRHPFSKRYPDSYGMISRRERRVRKGYMVMSFFTARGCELCRRKVTDYASQPSNMPEPKTGTVRLRGRGLRLAAVFPPMAERIASVGLRFSFALSFLKRKGKNRNEEVYLQQLHRKQRYEINLILRIPSQNK